MNVYREEEDPPRIHQPDYSKLESDQRDKILRLRATRDADALAAALGSLMSAARQPGENLLPHIVTAVKAKATLGEVSDTLRAEWGVFRAVAAPGSAS